MNLKLNEEKIRIDLKNLEAQKMKLEAEITFNLQTINRIQSKYDEDINVLSNKLKKYENLIERRMIFNDENNELFNSYNSSKKSFNNVFFFKLTNFGEIFTF